MQITLVAFAMLREAFPSNPWTCEVPENLTAQELMAHLGQQFPEIAEILHYTRLAHAEDYVPKEALLKPNAEYCLIPPVSGGSSASSLG